MKKCGKIIIGICFLSFIGSVVFEERGGNLFSIGDKMIYSSEGVYFVKEFTTSPLDKNDTRQFYVLCPVYASACNTIITPVGNDKVAMRPIMSREEALEFICKIPDIPTLTVEREKERREVYKKALASATPEAFVSIIKTVMGRREIFLKAKKRLSESDNDYERKAKFCLGGELASALDIPFDKVESFILEKISLISV